MIRRLNKRRVMIWEYQVTGKLAFFIYLGRNLMVWMRPHQKLSNLLFAGKTQLQHHRGNYRMLSHLISRAGLPN
jgi:hypothetical protein